MKRGDMFTLPAGTEVFSCIYNDYFPVSEDFILKVDAVTTDGYVLCNGVAVQVHPDTLKLAKEYNPMAKKVKLPDAVESPEVATPAPETRDVAAEQASQQKTLDHIDGQRQTEADRAAKLNAEVEAARIRYESAMNAAAREQHQIEMRLPLTPAEYDELIVLEKQAMMSGNRDPQNMHRLADLRIRSKVGASNTPK